MSEMSPKSQSDDASGTDVRARRDPKRDVNRCWPESFTQGTDIAPGVTEFPPWSSRSDSRHIFGRSPAAGAPMLQPWGFPETEENRVARA